MNDKPFLVKCNNCTKEWMYKGKNKYYVCCPDCRRYTPIRQITASQEVSDKL